MILYIFIYTKSYTLSNYLCKLFILLCLFTASFMRDLTITVDGELCNRFKGPAPSGYLAKPAAVVECVVPLIGRTLRISKQGRDLILCEVEWY